MKKPYTSKYFSKEELACKCGCGDSEMDELFLRVLDNLRVAYGQPIFLNSAKRCAEYNKKVGGVPNSAHLTGNAVDIRANGGKQRYNIVTKALILGIARIGVAKSFVHLDMGQDLPTPSLWTY